MRLSRRTALLLLLTISKIQKRIPKVQGFPN